MAEVEINNVMPEDEATVVRTLQTMVAAQNLIVDFIRWQKDPKCLTPMGAGSLLNGLEGFIKTVNGIYPDGGVAFTADITALSAMIGAEVTITYEGQPKEVIH